MGMLKEVVSRNPLLVQALGKHLLDSAIANKSIPVAIPR
jgi:hypothetical protein